MKTLNQTLRTILLALAFIGTATTATAYDFVVNGIYYNKNGDEVSVTYKRYYTEYGNYYYENDYRGDVIIPETVTFEGVTYHVTSIGDYAFYNRNASSALTGITLPNTISSIGKNAFRNCWGLKDVSIPLSVTNVDDYAFYYCVRLTNIVIPDSVQSIGNFVFESCSALTSISFGKSVSSIGYSFQGTNLRVINCLSATPPIADGFPNYSTKLYVPIESLELYRTSSVWSSFTNIFGFGENYFSIPDVTTFHGDTIVIPVSMENVDEITAFQTDIYLPEGFELVTKNGEYMVELSDRKGRDHVIMANDAADGAIRVLSYSPTLKTFKNNDGELFYLTVKVPDNGDGNYRLELNNTMVTTIDEEEIHALNAWNNIMVFSYTLGDVDGSVDITVADIVQTARYILNYNPEPFIFDAADINGDSKITITDVVKIAHMVLDADYGEPTQKMNAPANGDNMMSGEMDKNTHSVAISLNNDQDYTAFQLDLTLPEGMTASDFALTERANDLCLNVKDRGNGKIRVVGYTANLKTIKGNEGNLLTFHVTGNGEIGVDHIALVTPEGQTVNLGGFVIALNNATSVNEIAGSKEIAHVDYYDLTGQRIDRPEYGVTLVVTTYTDETRTTTKVIK